MRREVPILDKIVLVNRWVLLQTSWWVIWFMNEVKEDISYLVLVWEVLVTIVDAVVVVVPDADDLCALLFHFDVVGVVDRVVVDLDDLLERALG